MTSVWQAAAMAGVPSLQLVRWNHRYRLWPLSGTARGLQNRDLARVLHLSDLVARGIPESEAAALALALELPDDALPGYAASGLVAAARSMDVRTLDETLTAGLAGPLGQRIDTWLMPELRRIGEAWAGGEITVAQEDFCSTGVVATLYAHLRAQPPAAPGAPVFVVGLPQNELHEIPLLATAVLLRRAGAGVEYLGADVATSTWVDRVASTDPAGMVLAARSAIGARRANDLISAVHEVQPLLPVWAGGRFAERVRGALVAPESVTAAVDAILTA